MNRRQRRASSVTLGALTPQLQYIRWANADPGRFAVQRPDDALESVVRTAAMRNGTPMPDTLERMKLLHAVGKEKIRAFFVSAQVQGLKDPVIVVLDIRTELVRSMIVPALDLSEADADREAAAAAVNGDFPVQLLAVERIVAMRGLPEGAPGVVRLLNAGCPAGYFSVAIGNGTGISLWTIHREEDEDESFEPPARVEKDFGPS